jgi:hypothetical protein
VTGPWFLRLCAIYQIMKTMNGVPWKFVDETSLSTYVDSVMYKIFEHLSESLISLERQK